MNPGNRPTDELNALWQRHDAITDVTPLTPDAILRELGRRRRRVTTGLVVVAVAFATLTILSIAVAVTASDLDVRHYAYLTLLNGLIWSGWGLACQRCRFGRGESWATSVAVSAMTVADTLRLALTESRRHRHRLTLIGIGLLAGLPLIVWSLSLLTELGRIPADQLPARIAFAAAAYAIAAGCLIADRFGRHRNEARQIERMIESTAEPEDLTSCR